MTYREIAKPITWFNGVELIDVSGDESWADVICVERRHDKNGNLTGQTNHRDVSYAQRCSQLLGESK